MECSYISKPQTTLTEGIIIILFKNIQNYKKNVHKYIHKTEKFRFSSSCAFHFKRKNTQNSQIPDRPLSSL